ncbi:MAG TPA: imidazole glycerol phosphate synthase subunit HisH [Aggregatilineales bacterium]|nr:imidazole glycerol phosphate synthase subunit HisH [Anaerolineales bacterium]HRE47105.1 imidazole glycerol phosphate synthase subunit HisH [Aggregatilineales bacterium]
MATAAIIDYGLCNLDSVARAIEDCGGKAIITDQAADIERATHIILPGVGAFRDAMRNLKAGGLDEVLGEQVVGKQIPFLGICLGLQLLAAIGTEGGESSGLGWIAGRVERFTPTPTERRIPHIGWNEVHFERETPLFRGIASGRDFYFVHSYHIRPDNAAEIVAHTPYCGQFVSAIQRDWIHAVQFHPEKSQKVGFQVLRNFLTL